MHITLGQHCTPGFILFETKNRFIIETQQKVISHQSSLSIDRLTGRSHQITQKQFFDFLRNEQPLGQKTFWAIYGSIVIHQIPYLALVKQAQLVTTQKQNPIYKVKSLIFIRFNPDKNIPQTQQQIKVIETINTQIISENFYFSYLEDLTLAFKKKIIRQDNDYSESKFFWNQKNIRFLSQCKISKPWIITMIQGYVDCISQNGIQYRIIARRSKHKSGTRYNHRGINLQGFASNFVQVQEKIQHHDKIFSFISLRGSIPIYWSQQNNMSPIQFPQSEQKDLKGLKKHYDSLAAEYESTINTINLLSEKKTTEKSLTERFMKALQACNIKEYYYFDLNGFSEDVLHENIEKFVVSYQQKQSVDNFDFYDNKLNIRISKQHHIPRVNCLDCIDRTNVICCRIGESFVQKVAKILKTDLSSTFHKKYLENWATLGNKISQIYCGTYSVAEHLTLKQQASYWSSFTSSWRSVTRFFNASQSDTFKEQCNQYLLTQHPKSLTTYFSDNIFKYHLKTSDYCQLIDVDLAVITWNVGASSSDQIMEVDKMIFAEHIFGQDHHKAPGIIFITLQQIVELNSYNVVTNDSSEAKKSWQTIFFSVLNHYNSKNAGFTYTLYFSEALVGIASFVFVKNSLNPQIDMLNRIRKIFNYEVRRGIGQMLGNKGSIVSGFYIFDSVLINFASHLAAGDEKRKERNDDIKSIMDSIHLNEESRKVSNICDFMFFTGDLNFRLSSSDQQTRALLSEAKKFQKEQLTFNNGLKNQTLYKLFKKDEFFEVYKNQSSLNDFHEYPITFYPTYRYVKNGDEHDNKRKPAWTDRIFYYALQRQNIHCEKYTAIDKVKISDHRPVIAEFKITVKHQDKEKKGRLIEQFLVQDKKQSKLIPQPMHILPKTRYNYD